MENASKALMIAGAILVTLTIVTLAIVILRNWLGLAEDVSDLTPQQVSAINEKITPFLGDHVRGSQVNSLIQRVQAMNRSEETIYIDIYINKAGAGEKPFYTGEPDASGNKIFKFRYPNETNPQSKLATGQTYGVEATDWDKAGYINKIVITDNN